MIFFLFTLFSLNLSKPQKSKLKLQDDCIGAFVDDGVRHPVYYRINDTTRTLTIYGTGRMNDFTESERFRPYYSRLSRSAKNSIQSVIIEKGVTYIGRCAFYYYDTGYSTYSSVKNVIIPDSVTSIGRQSFQYTALEKIIIPKSVTEIGNNAFCNCDQLTNVKFLGKPNRIDSEVFKVSQKSGGGKDLVITYYGLESISQSGSNQFQNRKSVQIIVPTVYNGDTFCGCSNIQKTFPSGYCGSTTEEPKGHDVKWVLYSEDKHLDIIGTGLISNFQNVLANGIITNLDEAIKAEIESVKIPNGATFGNDVLPFDGFSALTKIILDYNTDFKVIDGILFNKNGTILVKYPVRNDLIPYNIPESVTSIGAGAFKDCKFLYSIKIPKNVASIGKDAFKGCRVLTSVRFEGNQNLDSSNEKNIFGDCVSLRKINVPGNYGSDSFCGKDVIKDYYKIIYELNNGTLADGSPNIYNVTVSTELIPPSKPGYIFSGWTESGSGGTTLELNVCICHDSTGDKKFTANWVKIKPIDSGYCGKDGGENVIWMFNIISGKFTISGTGQMADYISGSGMTLLGARTLNDNTCPWDNYKGLITSIIIESGVTSIGKGAFSNCYELTSITISETVSVIGNSAFSDCNALETINLQGDKEPTIEYIDEFASNNITVNVPNDYKGGGTFGGVSITKEDETKKDETKKDETKEDETKKDEIKEDGTKEDIPSTSKNTKLSGGAKAGIVIGTFAVVSTIIGIAGLFIIIKIRQKDSTPEASDKAVPKEDAVPEATAV